MGKFGKGLEAKVSGPFLFWEVLQEGITHAKSAKPRQEYGAQTRVGKEYRGGNWIWDFGCLIFD